MKVRQYSWENPALYGRRSSVLVCPVCDMPSFAPCLHEEVDARIFARATEAAKRPNKKISSCAVYTAIVVQGQTWFICSLYSSHSEQAEQNSSALEHLCWRTPEYSVFRGGVGRTVTRPVPKIWRIIACMRGNILYRLIYSGLLQSAQFYLFTWLFWRTQSTLEIAKSSPPLVIPVVQQLWVDELWDWQKSPAVVGVKSNCLAFLFTHRVQ